MDNGDGGFNLKKLKTVHFDEQKYDLNKMLSTKYDHLFRDVIRDRGIGYYTNNRVENFHKSKNKISAIVKGTSNYNVSVEYLDNDEIKVSCECEYHKSTDIYCKHVYTLLLTLKLMYEKEKLLRAYNKNVERIKEIDVLIKQTYYENKKYLNVLMFTVTLSDKNKYLNYIKKIEDFIDETNIYKVRSALRYSCEYLNYTIEDYNRLLDKIEEGKQVIEERKRKKAEEKLKPKEVEEETEGYTWTIGEGLEEALDDFIAGMPLEVLEAVRQQDIANGDDTEIMDKAIAERKRRDEVIRKEQERQQRLQEAEERKWRKRYRRAAFFGLLSGLFDGLSSSNSSNNSSDTDYLMPWEEDLVEKGEYEPYHFEEEEMEEDDFYYEDD
jgi:hypothetical protein